jgi:hypothetical protein
MVVIQLRQEVDWLNRPDVIVIGFQEIVPLTAQQIVQTDPEKKSVAHSPSIWGWSADALITDVYGRTKLPRPSNDGRTKSAITSCCAASRYLTIQSAITQAYSFAV